jgi:hypothetical protein
MGRLFVKGVACKQPALDLELPVGGWMVRGTNELIPYSLVEITLITAMIILAYLDSRCMTTTLSGSGGVGGPHIGRKREVSRTPGEQPPRGLDNQEPGFLNLLLIHCASHTSGFKKEIGATISEYRVATAPVGCV